MLFEAGGDGPKVLEFIEEALDEVAVAVEERAECRLVDPAGERLDVGPGTAAGEAVAERIAVVGAVGQRTCPLPMASSMSAALWPSCAWPSVSFSAIGRPSASTRAWILVVSPPRERPMHRG